jgi:filamentous hemagglutinin family protein
MNRIYRLVWSHGLSAWVAVAETARGRGKNTVCKLLAVAFFAGTALVHAAPIGGVVVAGNGKVSQSGNTTTIEQNSQNLSLNWQSFNVGKQESVNFIQPSASAIAVNRIFDTNGSQILGRLNANGQVWLINPNGVLFGQGAQVNVGGLVASTLELASRSADGKTVSFSGPGNGSVVNQGTLNAADGGYIALLGSHVSNQGTINARLGTVALGAGNAATLNFNGDSLVSLQIDHSLLNALADNGGLIQADGGRVLMSAGARNAALASVVNNTGIIEARTIENHNGTIILLAGMTAGTTHVGGTLDASAPGAGQGGGNGGFIETSAAHVKVADSALITTKAASGNNGRWLIDPYDFTIAASGGDITGAALSAALGSNDVTIQTANGNVSCTGATCGSGNSAGNGDIFVNDIVTWASHTLTLNAWRNININAALNGSGSASLALVYGQGAVAAGNTATYHVNAPVNLSAGNHFSTRLGSDGVAKQYTVITDLGAAGSTTAADLQGMSGNLTGNYVLGANIDAAATSVWNAGAGFAPVGWWTAGDLTTQFTGTFDGLGHTINGLTIKRPTTNDVGLFGYAGAGSAIRNVGLVGGSITGNTNVGGLVGENSGSISNSYATGSVLASVGYVGGLVGRNYGTISNSYATGSVSGDSQVGGLVGWNVSGSISNSYATGSVSGASDVGGLAGEHSGGGSISNSYATGSVKGDGKVGGLVGWNNGSVSTSYATGSVTGLFAVGGLVGENDLNNSIGNSFWNTTTGGGRGVGSGDASGATGKTSAQMQSLATFSGWSIDDAGGTTSVWRIYDGHSTPLLRSFLTQLAVTASSGSKVYDGTTDGVGATFAAYNPALIEGVLKIAAASKNVGSHVVTASGWYSSAQNGYDISYVGGTLTIGKANLIVSTGNVSKTYNGSTDLTGATGQSAIASGGTALFGSDSLSGGTFAYRDKNAGSGTKAVTVAGVSVNDGNGGGNYDVSYADNITSTISKASLIVSTNDVSKTYNGSTDLSGATGQSAIASGGTALFGSDSLSGGAFAYTDRNAGSGNKTVTVAGVSVNDGNGGNNYNVSYADNSTSTITPADLTISGITAANKIYNGTTAATVSTAAVTKTGLFAGDDLTVAATGTFDNKNVGDGKTVTLSSSYGGADVGNYTITGQASTTANITPAVTPPVVPPVTPPVTPPSRPADNGTGPIVASLQSPLLAAQAPADNAAHLAGNSGLNNASVVQSGNLTLSIEQGGVRLPGNVGVAN